MVRVNRRVEMAANVPPHNKLRVKLECGHEFLCDHSVTKMGRITDCVGENRFVMACPKCEEEGLCQD